MPNKNRSHQETNRQSNRTTPLPLIVFLQIPSWPTNEIVQTWKDMGYVIVA